MVYRRAQESVVGSGLITAEPIADMTERDFLVSPGGRLAGAPRVPGDKSISHRALIIGALAEGDTEVTGMLSGADCHATAAALQTLGADIDWSARGAVRIHGVGREGLKPASEALDLGNSGTGLRLLAGVAAAQPFVTELTGDASLKRRPMRRIIDPLERMGARIDAAPGDVPPLVIEGRRPLDAIRYAMPLASAQLKSAILLAGLFAKGDCVCREPAPTRDHSERLLAHFGADIIHEKGWIGVRGGATLKGAAVSVPADLSSAAFLLVGATIAPGSDLWLTGVGLNPTRDGVIAILNRMGARVEIVNQRHFGHEPVADLHVRAASLKGIEIPPDWVPLAIDEFPALMVAAACAEGETVLAGAAELRVKESNRLASIAAGLDALGVPVKVTSDGMRVRGIRRLSGGTVDSAGDHRIAMAFAIAGLRAAAPVVVRNVANVATSFPGFVKTVRESGLAIEETAR